MKFNMRLCKLREEAFLTKTQLAEILGTTRQMVTRYEKGDSTPTIDVLLTVANHFGVSADFLLGRDDYATLPKDKNQKYVVVPNELTEEDIEIVNDMIYIISKKRKNSQN